MKKQVLMFVAALLVTVNSYAAVGDVWDAGLDFSSDPNDNPNVQNDPNREGEAIWEYLHSNGTLLPNTQAPFLALTSNGWAAPGGEPVIVGPGPTSCQFGQLSDSPQELSGWGGAAVRWTSPISGWVEISGGLIQPLPTGITGMRVAHMVMSQNGTEFSVLYGQQNADGTPKIGVGINHPDRAVFGSLLRQVSVNDTLLFLLTGTPQAELPIPYAGTDYNSGYTCTAYDIQITQVEPPQEVTLTMAVRVDGGAVGDPSGEVTPPVGAHVEALGGTVPISAETFYDCPTVLVFDHWEGGGVADPSAASTTVSMTEDRTVTAVYVDGRVCGDECHPISVNDLNDDCMIDLLDLAVIAGQWLNCTQPGCDVL